MSRFVIAAWVAVAAMATILFNTSLVAAEVSLKMVSMMPKKHPIGKSYNGFVTRLNKEFKGEFQIDWRGGPEVIQQFKQPNAVRIGSIDMTLTSPSYVNGILSVSGSANYSNKTYEEIRASGYLDYMAELHAAKGLIYVGELPVTQLKFHLYFNKEIKTIDEIKNLKIRVFPAIAAAVKSLGATPVVLPMPEIYSALERGIVDGFSTGVSGVAKQYKGLIKSYTTPGFYRAAFHILVNPKAWAKLSPGLQKKVTKWIRTVEPTPYQASWNGGLKAGYKQLAETNVKAIKFPPEVEKRFSRGVLEAAWAAVKKKAPKEGQKLQNMLMK